MCAGNHRHPGDTDHDWERRMAEADERARAEDERERRIEQTPVTLPEYGLAVHADEAMRDTWATARKLDAIWAVLKRELPGTASWVRGTAAYTPDERQRLCEEILAAAETAI